MLLSVTAKRKQLTLIKPKACGAGLLVFYFKLIIILEAIKKANEKIKKVSPTLSASTSSTTHTQTLGYVEKHLHFLRTYRLSA